MKLYKILPLMAMSLVAFNSCDDQVMDWGKKDPTKGAVTGEELPLPLAEKITRYAPLKSYATNFLLGAGIDDVFYMNDEEWRNIVNENFEDVTVGYAMKHGPMVTNTGALNFGPMDAFVARTKTAGLSIYGHTLAWHSNQNATYLNGLIADQVIPGTPGTNLFSNGDFEGNSLAPWGGYGNGSTRSVSASGEGFGGGYAMVLTNPVVANSYSAQQFYDFATPLTNGKEYTVTFMVKASAAASIQFELQNPNDYSANYSGPIPVTTNWTAVTRTITPSTATRSRFLFDFGDSAATFMIDKIVISDGVAPTPTVTNLITNGTFEANTLTPWGGYGNGSTRSVSPSGEGFGGGYAMVLTNPVIANSYSAQQFFDFATPLTNGKEYTVTFNVKASSSASIQFELQNPTDYSANYSGPIPVTTSWTSVTRTITPNTATRSRFLFDFGDSAATFYIDNVVVSDGVAAPSGSGPTIIPKTDAEKATIIGAALEDWIKNMVGHYKNDIFAWDVVNEPIRDDNGQLRNGTEQGSDANDFFSWIKYLGKDYGVMAFKYARQYGNPTDKLFINDYNLEQSSAKLDGLLEYVKYIEGKGATIDGIATQMHVSYNTNRDGIVQMFTKMAATGKLIKVSELDVRLGTATPTAALQAQQADMYKFIIDKFREIVPAAQQYGITIWGISDKPEEHIYWLPNESPCLWDANYARKHAYKGTADGLAGKDVSLDFTGLLNP